MCLSKQSEDLLLESSEAIPILNECRSITICCFIKRTKWCDDHSLFKEYHIMFGCSSIFLLITLVVQVFSAGGENKCLGRNSYKHDQSLVNVRFFIFSVKTKV